MWYAIQTMTGEENILELFIRKLTDRSKYKSCFCPMYENVWRKMGKGNISKEVLFPGYVFIDTENIEDLYEEFRRIPKLSKTLGLSKGTDNEDALFFPISDEEELFLSSILTDGVLRVSYIKRDRSGKILDVVGALEPYRDQIVKLDVPHRRAFIEIMMFHRLRRIKFGLWTDVDDKIEWLEEELKVRKERNEEVYGQLDKWDWKKRNQMKKMENDIPVTEEAHILGLTIGTKVINTNLYGDKEMEVTAIDDKRRKVKVSVEMFGQLITMEMNADELKVVDRM